MTNEQNISLVKSSEPRRNTCRGIIVKRFRLSIDPPAREIETLIASAAPITVNINFCKTRESVARFYAAIATRRFASSMSQRSPERSYVSASNRLENFSLSKFICAEPDFRLSRKICSNLNGIGFDGYENEELMVRGRVERRCPCGVSGALLCNQN